MIKADSVRELKHLYSAPTGEPAQIVICGLGVQGAVITEAVCVGLTVGTPR